MSVTYQSTILFSFLTKNKVHRAHMTLGLNEKFAGRKDKDNWESAATAMQKFRAARGAT